MSTDASGITQEGPPRATAKKSEGVLARTDLLTLTRPRRRHQHRPPTRASSPPTTRPDPRVLNYRGVLQLLKCLCGLVASRTADVLHPREEWRPPKLWLEILFARSSMPDRWGLYVVSRPGERTEVAPGFAFAALSDAQRSVYGLKASFIEKRFVLAMAAPAERPLSPIDPDQFRSSGFVDTNTLNMIMTTLTWPAGQQGGTMTVLHDNPRGS